MAGTVTQDLQRVGPYQMLEMVWTSDASGDATADTDYGINGAISHVETIPDGTDAPTADYDVTLKTVDDRDVAGGKLSDRSATAAEMIKISEPCLGNLALAVSNAGNAKKGKLRIFFFR